MPNDIVFCDEQWISRKIKTMTSIFPLSIFLSLMIFFLSASISAQSTKLSKQQIEQDLEAATKILNENSSYVYLNGYDFNDDFRAYLQNLKDSTNIEHFGLFLTETTGKIGDRHFSVTGYRVDDSMFLPFMFAPLNGKVAVISINQSKQFELAKPQFPYLKKIDGVSINDFLAKIYPKDIKAPKEAYFTRAVRELCNIERNYIGLGKSLPKEITLTLTDEHFQKDIDITIKPVNRAARLPRWEEDLTTQYDAVKDEDFNKPEIIDSLFDLKDNLAYIKIPKMIGIDEAPLLFERLNSFMRTIKNDSKALIIDVRENGGGTRDITYDLAKYLIPPDSVSVVNVTKQRAKLPLAKEYQDRLHARRLFNYSELDRDEQKSVTRFMKNFRPMYKLDHKKYSEYYFGLFNGKKLSTPDSYYNKPIYILANERTFSAASVFVSVFKGIKNIKIVGVKTDGSSGNSERFTLPNSKIQLRISTMVSFQKNGKTLDGIGTEPDIKIERDLNQVLWRSDSQLEKLRTIILNRK